MKTDITKALEKNAVKPPALPPAKKEVQLTKDAEEDYNIARVTLHDIISKSGPALEDMLALAGEAEHPRAYEVLATLMKATADITQQLIDLQKRRHELDQNQVGNKKNDPTGTVTNNTVFIGSTAELQKFLQQQNEKLIDASEVDTI